MTTQTNGRYQKLVCVVLGWLVTAIVAVTGAMWIMIQRESARADTITSAYLRVQEQRAQQAEQQTQLLAQINVSLRQHDEQMIKQHRLTQELYTEILREMKQRR